MVGGKEIVDSKGVGKEVIWVTYLQNMYIVFSKNNKIGKLKEPFNINMV